MPTTSQALKTAQFGIIGLGVMGGNLALNLDDHHHSVAVWNLESEWVDRFVGNNCDRHFVAAKSLPEFCHSLERPRRILMMITLPRFCKPLPPRPTPVPASLTLAPMAPGTL